MNLNRIPDISFAGQNMRSLNVSSNTDKTFIKIQCIVKCKADIIFLTDLRLNSSGQIAAVEGITKKFMFFGYDFFHNAATANRGSGILIRKKINASVSKTYADANGNFLLTH